ncbi:helix-turn-helix domain-containing protein [Facklamia sp. P9177]|uniref:helix-turn-helix domain-containing protein n=1 Tax=Facklamia sp. P9177 TaxID=3421945 RepID=UPI003D1667A0
MDIDKLSVGRRIKEIRFSLGETAEVFGKHFDPPANRGLVSGWENGRYLPNPERLSIISELANISVDQLLYGSLEEYIINRLKDFKNEIENDSTIIEKLKDPIYKEVYLSYFHEYAPKVSEMFDSKEQFEEKFKLQKQKAYNHWINTKSLEISALNQLMYEVNRAFDKYHDYYYMSLKTGEYNYYLNEDMNENLLEEITRLKNEVFEELQRIELKYKDNH